ncbi:MAG TPA: hypothetical protein VIC30_13140, partial [Orrella sp.]
CTAFFSKLSLTVSFALSGIEAVRRIQCGDGCSRVDILSAEPISPQEQTVSRHSETPRRVLE